jgi:hypothetical protein
MTAATATRVKNPGKLHIDRAAITLWILRCAPNDVPMDE